MSDTLAIVFSIFGLIGIGYCAVRTKLLAAPVGGSLTAFAFNIAIPCLVFATLATADLQGLSPWRIWAAYFAPFAAVWALSHLMMRRIFRRDARAALVGGVSAAFANSVLIGIPLMHAAFGAGATVFLIVIVSVHLPIMMLGSIVLNEWALRADGVQSDQASRSQRMRDVAATLITHPILLAILGGFLWRLTGLPLPRLLAAIVEPLGRSAGPIALFASGMALMEFGVSRQIRPAFAIAGLKLIVMPTLVFTAASALGLPPLGVAAVTLTAACPTGVNAFLVASQLGTGQALASNALLISTAGGVVTITLWLIVLQSTLA